jgi:hypothetical protein
MIAVLTRQNRYEINEPRATEGVASNQNSSERKMSEAAEMKSKDEGQSKDMTIVVNGREKTISEKELTFGQLVALAFDNPPTGEFICFTITYRRGQGNKPEGSLTEDETVKIKKGMIFNVTATDKS